MTILITGGASGLGKAITESLINEKEIRIIITYNNSLDSAKGLESSHTNIRAVKCNFVLPQDVEMLMNLMEEENIDVLINNAFSGIKKEHFFKMDQAHFSTSFSENIIPVIRITQKAIGIFRKNRFGKIITILSSSILNKPPIGWSCYVAEKNYLLSLAKSWAIENSKFNITSNMISPSFMLTDLNKDTDERLLEDMRSKLPLQAFLKPEEVAESVRFLVYCTQQINGHNLIINQAENLI